MTSLSEIDNRQQEELSRKVEELLSRNPAGAGAVPRSGQVSIFVRQNAHGLTRGQAAYLPTGASSWVVLTNNGSGNWVTPGETVLWGIVDRVRANSFTITVSGLAVIPGASLTPGAHYFFSAGAPVALTAITNRQVPQMLLAQAVDATHVFVQSAPAVQNQFTQDALYEHVTLANALGAVVGDVLAIDNSNAYVLALSDPAHPDKANVHGVLVYDLGSGGGSNENFLMACEGWADIDQAGDMSSRWPVSSGHPARYLSSTTAGRTVDVAPALPVLVCYGNVTYNSGTGRSSGNLRLAGPGRTDPIALPVSLANGGTGVDLTTVLANSVILMNAAASHLVGTLNIGSPAFLTQDSGGAAYWTLPDSTIFQVTGSPGSLKLKDGTTLGQFLRWSGTAWQQYGPLMNAKGQLLSHDGTDLVTVTADTALSVVGNSTNASAVPAAIAAASADTVLGRRGTALTWAKVARAEMADGSACSVIGRSANSSGAVADIAAGSDGLFLTRASGALTWAAASIPYVTTYTHHTGSSRDFTTIVGYGGYSNTTGDDVFQFRFYANSGLGAPSAYTDGVVLWSYKVMSSDPFLGSNNAFALASPGLSVGSGCYISVVNGGQIGLDNAGSAIVGQGGTLSITYNNVSATTLHATSAFTGTITIAPHSFTFVDGICTAAS